MKRFLPYRAVVSARYRMLLQYRAAAFAGLVTQCFWGAIRLMIVAAFYAASTQAQPMSLPDVVVYIWLGQAFFGMLPWNIDAEFAQQRHCLPPSRCCRIFPYCGLSPPLAWIVSCRRWSPCLPGW